MTTAEALRLERDAPPRESAVLPVLLAATVPVALVALFAGLAVTGALNAQLLVDPGVLVTRGLPIARLLADGSASLAIGLLTLATFALPGQREVKGLVSFSQWTATRWAAVAAGVWTAAQVAVLLLAAADVLGTPVGSDLFRSQIGYFATGIELGQQLALSALLAAAVLVVSLLARRIAWVAVANAAAVAALLPLSLSGHAAGADEHGNAVSSMAIHLIAVTAWAGGLVGLVLLRRRIGDALGTVAARYSILAGWAFFAVAASGLVNAWLRLGSPADLVATGYGLLVTAKAVLLVALGVAGILHRRRLLPRLAADAGDRAAFLRLAVGEVVGMAVAMGLSVALSRSAPPVSQDPDASTDAFLGLVGYPEPPPVSFPRMLTEWHLDVAFLGLAGILLGTYLVGVARLRRRGDAWPLRRTIPWVLGCLGLVYVTNGGPGVYGPASFSTHMLQHMGLMMFVPPLLVLGAPILLAMRALPVRRDGSRGIREWLLVLVHSRVARVFSNPVIAGLIFAGSLVVFYYTDWFPFSLSEHQGHVLMVLHFLLGGYLFYWVLIGEDPGPQRPSPPVRLLVLLATLTFHAFFGLALMSQEEILALDWWHALGYTDDAALLADQRAGGGLAWGAGEVPTVLVALVVVRQWIRSDARAAKRSDRAAERDGDAELNAYNARLAALAERDSRR
ncbi:cytochrome c oxidase assembly protein [Naasia sp. SYSU D00057]|uniref:cytochrome c oxidase assembly protein n=1 Tax=Naasia sp. SYSU D00057 TaxID=2817380 RepID=UPI0027DB25F1|nr:cytochrome c oxidase assembly protein [Naasia sp. SYSU D00057]